MIWGVVIGLPIMVFMLAGMSPEPEARRMVARTLIGLAVVIVVALVALLAMPLPPPYG